MDSDLTPANPSSPEPKEVPLKCGSACVSRWGLSGVEPGRDFMVEPFSGVRSDRLSLEVASSGRISVERVIARQEAEQLANLVISGNTAAVGDVLLTGFAHLLHRLSGQDSFWIGFSGSGNGFQYSSRLGSVKPFQNPFGSVPWTLRGQDSFRDMLLGLGRLRLGFEDRGMAPSVPGPEFALVVEYDFDLRMETHRLAIPSTIALADGVPSEVTGALASVFRLSTALNQAGLHLKLEGPADQSDAETLQAWLGYYVRLLTSATDQPDVPVQSLEILTEAERLRLLEFGSGPESGSVREHNPPSRTVSEHFRAQAASNPSATALICGQETLTYGQLDFYSEEYCNRLRSLGTGPGRVAAVCLPRSLSQIIAILGVLKTGAVCLPLDPFSSTPAQNQAVLQAAQPVVVLADPALLPRLPQPAGAVVKIEDLSPQILPRAHDKTAVGTTRFPAYLMFAPVPPDLDPDQALVDSIPLGVMVEHGAIIGLVTEQPHLRLGLDRVFLQLSPLTDGASLFEIWGALLHGATLVIAPEQPPGPAELQALIQNHGVTTLCLPPEQLEVVLKVVPAALHGVEDLVTNGVTHQNLAIDRLSAKTRLIFALSFPESILPASFLRVTPTAPGTASGFRIGKPGPGSRAYVLDACGSLVPVGVAGELYLAGAGVSSGEWNQTELTAQKFLADPFSKTPGGRMFRTGSRARWCSDGTLELLG